MKNQNSLDITSITSLGGDAYKRKISKSFWQNSISQKFAEWWWSTCLAWSCHPTPPILLTIGIIISLSFWLTDRLNVIWYFQKKFFLEFTTRATVLVKVYNPRVNFPYFILFHFFEILIWLVFESFFVLYHNTILLNWKLIYSRCSLKYNLEWITYLDSIPIITWPLFKCTYNFQGMKCM